MDWGLARLENSSVAAAAVVALWMDGCYLLSLSWWFLIILRRTHSIVIILRRTYSIVIILRRTYSIVIIPIKEDLFDSNHTN